MQAQHTYAHTHIHTIYNVCKRRKQRSLRFVRGFMLWIYLGFVFPLRSANLATLRTNYSIEINSLLLMKSNIISNRQKFALHCAVGYVTMVVLLWMPNPNRDTHTHTRTNAEEIGNNFLYYSIVPLATTPNMNRFSANPSKFHKRFSFWRVSSFFSLLNIIISKGFGFIMVSPLSERFMLSFSFIGGVYNSSGQNLSNQTEKSWTKKLSFQILNNKKKFSPLIESTNPM